MTVYQPDIFTTVKDGINAILSGKEVVLVSYKNKLNPSQLSPLISSANLFPIASQLESHLLNIFEIQQFYEICCGKNWGLRPCPIFTQNPHTIITKNIGIHIGLHQNQIFEFTIGSTQNERIQQLMFKLKPNHKLGPGNHLIYYNRFDGTICLEPTDVVIEYNALDYLLIYSPLLVVHKRQDMLQYTANICVDNEFNLSLLHNIPMKSPYSNYSIREYDSIAALHKKLGFITHHGQFNSSIVSENKEMKEQIKKEPINEPMKEHFYRYLNGTKRTNKIKEINIDQPDYRIIDLMSALSLTQDDDDGDTHDEEEEKQQKGKTNDKQNNPFYGTLFHMWPTFLYRRNWFTALLNQREQGSWIGACRRWINESLFSSDIKHFLFVSWIPTTYHYLEREKTIHNGISASSLHSKQLKFLILNTRLMKDKILNEMTEEEKNDMSLLVDDFLPSDAWGNKLLKRRVVSKKETIILSNINNNDKNKSKNNTKNNTSKKSVKPKSSLGRKKTISKSRSRSRSPSRPREKPQDFDILPEEEISKSKLWLHRIQKDIK